MMSHGWALRRSRRAGIGLVLLLAMLSACGQRSAANARPTATLSPTATATPTHEPVATPTLIAGEASTPQPSLCRPVDTTAPLPSTLATIYAGTSDGTVAALNASDGSQRWSYKTGVNGTPLLTPTSALLYVSVGAAAAGSSTLILALGAADGVVHWQTQIPGIANVGGDVALTYDGGVVYLPAPDGMIRALDGASGAELWHFQTAGTVPTLVVVDGTVYVQDWPPGGAYALRASDGTQLWRFPTTAISPIKPVVANGLVYLAVSDTQLVALSAATGNVRWRFELVVPHTPSEIGAVTVSGTGVYVNAFHYIYALSANTGALCWLATACGQGATAGPLLDGDRLYAGCFYGDPGPGSPGPGCGVFALDANSGDTRWTVNVTGFAAFTPASVVNHVLFVGGTLQAEALNVATGAALWAFPAQSQPRQGYSVLVVGATAYAAGPDGKVYALSAADGSLRWSATVGGAAIAIAAGA